MANEAYLIIQRKYFHEHMKVLSLDNEIGFICH